ncbi:hypothetical protein Scep_018983 [Stephania cephalantha]|uniref:Uncharacterized protein n=1 Tax=Stephania cephalantha TaxID=152367 RepID=A0AAP0IA11_9MAGN
MTAATGSGSNGEGRRASVASAAQTTVRGAVTGHQEIDAREIANKQQQRLQGGLNSGTDGWTATQLQRMAARRERRMAAARRSGSGQ